LPFLSPSLVPNAAVPDGPPSTLVVNDRGVPPAVKLSTDSLPFNSKDVETTGRARTSFGRTQRNRGVADASDPSSGQWTLIGPQVAVGADLKNSLPGVDWGKNGRTLVLAISTRCHFCTDSAPFFKRIDKERPKDLKLVAVLPQPVEQSRKYLDGQGVLVDEVRQAPPESIGVVGTPTLLLVDARGKVSDVWRGKLQPDDEEKVIATLRGNVSGR